jgi:hypothetical protein
MNRRTTLLAAIGITAWASILVSQATAIAVAAPADRGNGSDNGQSERRPGYSIGLWGDMPYGDAGLAALPAVIADINKQDLAFTIFDGDIKSGSSLCADAQYTQAKTTFSSIKWATIYTPGDNEWTDCDRRKAGYYDPNERLALIRSTFFATGKSQGQDPLDVEQQSTQFPENARWFHDGVAYITIDVPGTDNNYPQVDASGAPIDADGALTSGSGKPQNGNLDEYTARNAANLAWLESGFRYAQTRGAKGIMIVQQADMWSPTDPTAHYADEKAKLAQLVASTKSSVVLVNGDTHLFAVDNPLTDATGATLPNFQRVTTDGEVNHGWTKVDVSPHAPTVFTFTRQVTTP